MKTVKRTLTFVLATGILAFTAISCSKASVADEDALYENHQGIDRTKIKVPEHG